MNIGELFFDSCLVASLIVLWLVSATSSMRIMLEQDQKVSNSLIISILFGPFAFMLLWVYGGDRASKRKLNIKSLASVVLSVFILSITFYTYFIASDLNFISNEAFLLRCLSFITIAGFLVGLLLSKINCKIAFFESSWTTFLFITLGLLLSDWADSFFSYGTSSTYFLALILTSTGLLWLFLIFGGSLGYLMLGEGRLNISFFYEKFIGMRFLMTKQSSKVVSLITVISVLAVTIACAGMIVVMGVMNGFTDDFKTKVLGANAHLMVLKYSQDFNEYDNVITQTKSITGIISATPFVIKEGMVSSDRNLSGAVITGMRLSDLKETERIEYFDEQAVSYLENANDNTAGVILGKEMALSLQVIAGDTVNLISPIGDIGPTGPIPKAKPFRVMGTFNSGMYDFDSKFAYIKLTDAQEFFNLKNNVTGIEYRVNDIDRTRTIAKKVEEAIGGYPFYARDWMQMNRNIFSALQLEKIAMIIILGTLVFMASLLILVTLIMVVMEKGKEIAILKSMGATDVSIMKIFVVYGLFIGGLGALLGGTLGTLCCFLIEKVGISLDAEVYYFSSLPVKIYQGEIITVILSAILISFLATLPPSLFAAKIKPVEGLRYE